MELGGLPLQNINFALKLLIMILTIDICVVFGTNLFSLPLSMPQDTFFFNTYFCIHIHICDSLFKTFKN